MSNQGIIKTLASCCLSLTACTTTWHARVPVGWRDNLSLYQPCTANSGSAVELRDGTYVAVAPGHATVRCENGDQDIEVHPLARLDLVVGADEGNGGSMMRATLHAYDDAGRELSLGTGANIGWQLGGVIEEPQCRHGGKLWESDPALPICSSSTDTVLLRGKAAGTGTITATFEGKQVQKTIVVK
jgi:hypothetical protein